MKIFFLALASIVTFLIAPIILIGLGIVAVIPFFVLGFVGHLYFDKLPKWQSAVLAKWNALTKAEDEPIPEEFKNAELFYFPYRRDRLDDRWEEEFHRRAG